MALASLSMHSSSGTSIIAHFLTSGQEGRSLCFLHNTRCTFFPVKYEFLQSYFPTFYRSIKCKDCKLFKLLFRHLLFIFCICCVSNPVQSLTDSNYGFLLLATGHRLTNSLEPHGVRECFCASIQSQTLCPCKTSYLSPRLSRQRLNEVFYTLQYFIVS